MIQYSQNGNIPDRILDVGTGTGLVALAAAASGCKNVIAIDNNKFVLSLVEKSKHINNLMNNKIETMEFDLKNFEIKLPEADLVCFADVLYEKDLGIAVAKRIHECKTRGSKILLVSPPTRPGKIWMINKLKELYNESNYLSLVEGKIVKNVDIVMPFSIQNNKDIRGKDNGLNRQDFFILEI